MSKGRRLVHGALVDRQPDRVVDDAACVGKTRWHTEKSAQWALAGLRAANPGAFDSTVRPYRCGSCRRWHLGHGR